MKRFGEKLRTLRARRRMSMQDVADAIEYGSSGYVSDVENGKREPALKFVIKVAEFFEVSTDALLKDSLELELPHINEGAA
jgi:transcriptional regulator with XRE-family HTH domain